MSMSELSAYFFTCLLQQRVLQLSNYFLHKIKHVSDTRRVLWFSFLTEKMQRLKVMSVERLIGNMS